MGWRAVNGVFLGLIVISVLTAAFTGTLPKLTTATVSSARDAVELAIGLLGQLALWLGLVNVLREAGLMRSLARLLEPVMRRLFPEVPADHPAMGAMVLNLAANFLGLGDAATPFGLKAMRELDTLNPKKGVASDAMVLFLALNTSCLALPLTVISLRAAAGSTDPAGIVVPTLLAATLGTVVAVLSAKLLQGRAFFASDPPLPLGEDGVGACEAPLSSPATTRTTPLRLVMVLAIALAVVIALGREVRSSGSLAGWLVPLLILTILTLGFARQVKVYDAFVTGAQEAFRTVLAFLPVLVGVLVAFGLFRASGALELLVRALSPALSPLGFPPEALPLALLRPFSGNGSLVVLGDGLKAYGPDSFLGYFLSVLNGSTQTTFYVVALYFGAVQVKLMRHTLAACLLGAFAAMVGALAGCTWLFAK